MTQPDNFSWVDEPLLAGMARPGSREELLWLREHGIDILLSLTEDAPFRPWVNEAGLMLVHLPVEDMTAPAAEQLEQAMQVIEQAKQHSMGVAVHCGAGLGRTGVILASHFVRNGMSADNAIARVRRLRPGSIETDEQIEAVEAFARKA